MIPGAAFGAAPAKSTPLSGLHPAMRLAWLLLAVVQAMIAPWPLVVVLGGALVAVLGSTGMRPPAQAALLRPWLPMAVLALLVHTVTTTTAAPLGHPSWPGLVAGLRALLRLAATLGVMAVYLRSGSLDDFVAGLGWWLRPLGRTGLSVDDLGLAMAVACGTVPQVMGEARRLQAVTRLRRHGPVIAGVRAARRQPWDEPLERARLVMPLLETLGRRAGALELALRHRRPTAVRGAGPRLREWALLGAGLAATTAAVLLGRGAST